MNNILFDKAEFARRLKKLREDKYHSQKSFSKAFNAEFYPSSEVTGGIYGTLQKYENESVSTAPTVDTLMKICMYLECDPDYLLGYHDGKTWGAHQVMKYTGLSEKAVEQLHNAIEQSNYFKLFCSDFISTIIEDDQFLSECAQWVKSYIDLPEDTANGHFIISNSNDDPLYYIDLETMKETIMIGLQNSIMRFIQRSYLDKKE